YTWRRVRFGKQLRTSLPGAEVVGRAATRQATRPREGFCRLKWSGKRRLEMAASAVGHAFVLSRGSRDFTLLRRRWKSDRERSTGRQRIWCERSSSRCLL